ncbi:MAG: ATP-binding protein [Bacteroidota bacterium]|nr:ATP-binding protein [Bacteroidota bacterium]
MDIVKSKSFPNEIIVESTTANLVVVRKFVTEAALRSGIDEDTTNRIVLAVDEACTNIIRHAYKNISSNPIEVCINQNKNKFEVVITDYGKPFDPNSVKKPDIKDNLKNYKKGGLGMFLMRSLVDEVDFRRDEGQKNVVRLIKYFN